MYINYKGHMTKMPPCPYKVKTLQNTSTPEWEHRFQLNMKHERLTYHNVFINPDPVVTLAYFMTRST